MAGGREGRGRSTSAIRARWAAVAAVLLHGLPSPAVTAGSMLGGYRAIAGYRVLTVVACSPTVVVVEHSTMATTAVVRSPEDATAALTHGHHRCT